MTALTRHAHSGRNGPLPQNRSSIVAVLDIGSSKICCIIAKLKPRTHGSGLPGPGLPGHSHDISVLGIGHQLSRGVKGGVIVDMDAAEHAIRSAVEAAERMAGITVESVILNISCGRIHSEAFSASVSIDGHEVVERDIQRVLHAGREYSADDSRYVVHSIPLGYTLDGQNGIRDPRGMLGGTLGVDIHVVSADPAPLRNLSLCISRCHLKIAAMVATPYASGLSCLVNDEAELGVLVIDMGGGTTSASIFCNGGFIYADVVTLGGKHVTNDIARGLSTTLGDAERIKSLYGTALPSQSDEREIISVPLVGDDGTDAVNQVPKSMLTGIIRPRLEETLELVRDRFNASGFARYAGKHAVLVGGASQLQGAREVAARILGKQVRIGRPLGISGMPEATSGPAFAAIAGLLQYPQIEGGEAIDFQNLTPRKVAAGGYVARVGQWIRESF
ncbi:MAG: cell division protein FtsA [Rhodobiaceae bacterium]|nr:cell division protein FtsA [Rhodobiaceae bacterium]